MESVMNVVMNATVGQIVGAITAALALISVFVEFSNKIKKFPISAVLNWIGERTNRDLLVRVKDLEKKVDGIGRVQSEFEEKFVEREAVTCRIRILRFSDELRRNIHHSKESFDQALSDVDVYEKYCDSHPGFKNNKTGVAKERIVAAYQECMDKDNFL